MLHLSYELFLLIRFEHTALLLKRSVMIRDGAFAALAANIFDDNELHAHGHDKQICGIVYPINQRLKLGAVVHGQVLFNIFPSP